MDVRTLAVVARAGIESLKFTKKKRAQAEEKARLEKEAAAKAEAARVGKAAEEARAAAEQEAAAEARAEPTAEAEAAQEQRADASAERATETPLEQTAEAAPPSETKAKAQAKVEPAQKKAKTATQRTARRERSRHQGVTKGFTLKSALSGIAFLGLFSVYLVIEVVTAIAIYIYLSLNHPETFRDAAEFLWAYLGLITDYLKEIYPQFQHEAFSSILDEMGKKAVLLLFIGLVTSAVTRFMVWGTGVVLDSLKVRSAPPKPTAAPAEAETSAA